MRSILVAFSLVSLLASGALADEPRCLDDDMGRTFCSRTEGGAAVRSDLGEIQCARGQCVRRDPSRGEWHCSRKDGGFARLTPAGPECEDGCVGPDESLCEQVSP